MNRLNRIKIDLKAIQYNFKQAESLVSQNTVIAPVIKSDAYGHGMLETASCLDSAGAQYFAVSDINEGIILRNAGFKQNILVLTGALGHEMDELIINRLIPVVHDLKTAEKLNQNKLIKQPYPVHIKIDTGIGRLGIPIGNAIKEIEKINSFNNLYIEGIMTHFASADEIENDFIDMQIIGFKNLICELKRIYIEPQYNHCANSAAIIRKKTNFSSMARPGIMLYGSYPSMALRDKVSLMVAMEFSTRLIEVKDLPAGHFIGYGCTKKLLKDTRIGVVPVGYNDGYSRFFSNKGVMIVNNRRCPVIGRVSMQLTILDLTDARDVNTGDEVVILGKQGAERISAEEMAEMIGTISYEIFCSLGRSNYREYIT